MLSPSPWETPLPLVCVFVLLPPVHRAGRTAISEQPPARHEPLPFRGETRNAGGIEGMSRGSGPCCITGGGGEGGGDGGGGGPGASVERRGNLPAKREGRREKTKKAEPAPSRERNGEDQTTWNARVPPPGCSNRGKQLSDSDSDSCPVKSLASEFSDEPSIPRLDYAGITRGDLDRRTRDTLDARACVRSL